AKTPGDFIMTVKASRYLTHVKRLRDPEEPVAKLMAAATGLAGRLGPVLLQLPPNLTADPERLAACLEAFARYPGAGARRPGGAGVRVAVEPRHPSWWTEEVRRCSPRTAPRCAGPTSSAARSPRCGGRPAGATSGSTRGRRIPGPATGRARC